MEFTWFMAAQKWGERNQTIHTLFFVAYTEEGKQEAMFHMIASGLCGILKDEYKAILNSASNGQMEYKITIDGQEINLSKLQFTIGQSSFQRKKFIFEAINFLGPSTSHLTGCIEEITSGQIFRFEHDYMYSSGSSNGTSTPISCSSFSNSSHSPSLSRGSSSPRSNTSAESPCGSPISKSSKTSEMKPNDSGLGSPINISDLTLQSPSSVSDSPVCSKKRNQARKVYG